MLSSYIKLLSEVHWVEGPGNVEKFSGVRAKEYLRQLTSLGPKVAGSRENEICAVNLLVKWLNEIKSIAEDHGRNLDIDVQISNGSLYDHNLAVYFGVKNVVARLRPGPQTPPDSLLVNAHFDTAPTSEGGGDDGSMCSVMLEVLHQLAVSKPLNHSVIFLFNGCEEHSFRGSHAFITKHSWASSVRAFINLDSAGNGGREIVFQANPEHPWLLKHYRNSVKRPYATVIAEEIFQHDLIPSKTDYYIFTHLGKIPGIDIAFAYNGYVYHTKYDKGENFPETSLQNTGDNLLPLVQSLASSEELRDPQKHKDGPLIYYDFLNLYQVSYSELKKNVLDIIAIVWACLLLGSCREFGIWKILYIACLCFIADIGGIIFAGIGATLCCVLGRSMFWFNSCYLVIPMYFFPFYLGMTLGPQYYEKKHRQESGTTISRIQKLFLHAQHTINTFLLSVIVLIKTRSSYLLMIPVLVYNISMTLNMILEKTIGRLVRNPLGGSVEWWKVIHLICQIFPFMLNLMTTISFFTTLIPIQGRSGAENYPEFKICALSIISAYLLGSYLIPLIAVCEKPRDIIGLFSILWFIGFCLMLTVFPFEEAQAPQRFRIQHVNRQFHSISGNLSHSSSGFLIETEDPHGKTVLQQFLGEADNLDDICAKEFLCKRYFGKSSSFWYSSDQLFTRSSIIESDTGVSLRLTERQDSKSGAVVMHFDLGGPDRMDLSILPEYGSEITDWSFKDTKFIPSYIYSISLTNFKLGVPQPSNNTQFWIKLEGKGIRKTLDITVIGHYMWHHEHNTPEFNEKIKKFPLWSSVNSWIVTYDHYKF
ncbi:endoplasmic reticulum metallopeptidase 1-like [Phlebotomus papatasi]|uniref:endoplasmic reticulum metallopeptidase 1-like n=1 Tax=Phlebotomus papatasi TaxID=29031 RepID=UPI00248463DF|nr:endoplasmic reticulum metallopeptidase 1-like [Phlebotomus papatasi]